MSIKCFGITDIGSHRAENQDCFGIYTTAGHATLCVVCDGMGGHAGGATASGTARDVFVSTVCDILELLVKNSDSEDALTTNSFRYALERGAMAANNAVRAAAGSEESLAGMGTTLVALLLCEGVGGCFVNVGDSRIYDITSGSIRQLTRDHSYVQHLVDIGQMSAEEARVSPVRNVITRAVGIDDTVRPDLKSVDISLPSDGKRWFLLCSDGLSGCVGEDILHTVVRDSGTLEEKASGLVGLANAAGGPDNITVLLVEL
ncbi:MAG: protein phosphatase 2C domain-containing protein [Clostridiales bacterium]|nr:protein phosphatase 2C domain-containing protein [Clostridiales bacterium]